MVKTRIQVLWALNALAGIVLVWSLTIRERMDFCLSRLSYYLVGFLVVLWFITVVRFLATRKAAPSELWKRYRAAALLSLAFAAFIFATSKPGFRVFDDELKIVSVSKSMAEERTVDNVIMSIRYYNQTSPIHKSPDKRPLLFPFLIHLFHIFTGYRPQNAFAANFLVLWALLGVITAALQKKVSPPAAGVFLLLIAAQPVFSLTAASAGYDLLFVFFMTLSFLSLKCFFENPSTASFEFMWMNLLMLLNIRREAPMLWILTILALLVLRRIKWEHLRFSFAFFATPLLLFPMVWQRLLFRVDSQWPKEGAFGISYFLNNNAAFFKNLFRCDFYLPYANLVNILGIVSLAYFFVRTFVRRKNPVLKENRDLWIVAGVNLAAEWVVVTSYYWGQPDNFWASRLYLPFCVVLSIGAGALLCRFLRRNGDLYLVMTAFLLLVLYHPVTVTNHFGRNAGGFSRNYRIVMEFLKQRPHSDFLLISERSQEFTIHDYGSINFPHANRNIGSILDQLRRHLFNDIFVVQDINYGSLEPTSATRLDPKYVLEPLFELQINSGQFIRISKVANQF